MKEHKSNPAEETDGTNLFPIYPDIDKPVRPEKDGKVTEEQLEREVDMINPDPDSLDRG